jgi:hypothetical protein
MPPMAAISPFRSRCFLPVGLRWPLGYLVTQPASTGKATPVM